MGRYRLEIEECFSVTQRFFVSLDADSPEEAEQLLSETQEANDTTTENLNECPELLALNVVVSQEDDEWTHEGRETIDIMTVAEIPDPNQLVMF